MFKPLELFVGLRYTGAKRRNHFISFIALTSMLGIALGVAALITVLSVMNGFQHELRSRILGMASHATITAADGPLAAWRPMEEVVAQHAHVIGTAPFIEGQAMLSSGQFVSGAVIQGILPEEEIKVSDIGQHVTRGSLTDLAPGEFRVVLGAELARRLGLVPGDKVTVITPQASVTPAGLLPRLKRFTVAGVFEVGMHEYDSGVALISLQDAERLFRLGNAVTGVRLKLDDIFAAPEVTHDLAHSLPAGYRITDWTVQHASFFRAVRIEKTVMFVILMLIVAVAAFNIVATLVMVVTDKQSDIAILRTLGAAPGRVMGIFMVQGTIIGFVGTLLGMVGGVSLALNVETVVPMLEHWLGVKFLSPDVYYITELPSDLHWSDVGVISAVAFGLSLLATIYPAYRAARTQPAEALRYE